MENKKQQHKVGNGSTSESQYEGKSHAYYWTEETNGDGSEKTRVYSFGFTFATICAY